MSKAMKFTLRLLSIDVDSRTFVVHDEDMLVKIIDYMLVEVEGGMKNVATCVSIRIGSYSRSWGLASSVASLFSMYTRVVPFGAFHTTCLRVSSS